MSISLKFTHQNRVLCYCFLKTGVSGYVSQFNLNFMPSRVDVLLTQPNILHVNSGFCHSVEEIFTFLGSYAVQQCITSHKSEGRILYIFNKF